MPIARRKAYAGRSTARHGDRAEASLIWPEELFILFVSFPGQNNNKLNKHTNKIQ
jgi:hypothetical protein